MDRFAKEVRAPMPLTDAVLLLWRHAADAEVLERLFESHCGPGDTEHLSVLSDGLRYWRQTGGKVIDLTQNEIRKPNTSCTSSTPNPASRAKSAVSPSSVMYFTPTYGANSRRNS